MATRLLQKLRQLHHALGVGRDLPVIEDAVSLIVTDMHISMSVDYSRGLSQEELENQKSLLIGLIGSLKDYLKVWCGKYGFPFEGDELINSNQSVALVHDLWNLDKHCELKRPPRSKVTPRVVGLQTALSIQVSPNASLDCRVTPQSGAVSAESDETVQISYRIVGRILDECGNDLGDFLDTCELAVTAWEAVMRRSGVPIL